ncbi:MAG: XisI protein [Saprospiraceae bacterium]
MDKIEKYQQIILELLEEYAAIPSSYPTSLRDEVVADTVRNHFQLITLGWEGARFVYEVVFHFDILDDKVWIQQNNTEANLAEELVERGIPKSDVVIGFQPLAVRAMTDYATA